MTATPSVDLPQFLTTREVADLLRVKERKVYDLAAADEIPHRRVTGKLLFPRGELMAWIDGDAAGAKADPPAVITGSHDPLLDWAVRESGSGLATLYDGSLGGLDAFAQRRAMLTGLHLPEPDDWNIASVARMGLENCVLLSWAIRARGLLVAPAIASDIQGVSDLKGVRLATRQAGAGAAALLDRLLTQEGLTRADIVSLERPARTENDAAAAVASGDADAALGIEAMARQFGLAFVPLVQERFDLLVDRKAYFSDEVQTLLGFSRGAATQERADAFGGYDLSELGRVRWVST